MPGQNHSLSGLFGTLKMEKAFDLLSMGEAVVEIFRKGIDVPLHVAGDFIGPYPSGAPAITVDTFARLGGCTGYIATVGNDGFGTTLIDRLSRDGVDTTHCYRLDDVVTGMAFTSYSGDGGRSFLYNFTTAATAYLKEDHIQREYIERTRWLHISGNVMAFSPDARNAVVKAVTIAHDAGIPISLDPNIRLEIMEEGRIRELMEPVLERATLLLPSEGELVQIYPGEGSEETVIEKLLSKNVELIVRKDGKAGCTFFSENGITQVDAIHEIDKSVVDPTGAGDSFCAGIIYGLLQGWSERDTGLFANAVGGIATTKNGAMEGVEKYDDVISLLEQNQYDFLRGNE
jgi:sugar/nucleoside kinase (ribokinase family)